MSHLEGHIDGPPGSFGKITFDAKPTIILEFPPPPFNVVKSQKIGFHPMYNNDHSQIIAMDVVDWADHEIAEGMAITYIKNAGLGNVNAIEEIFNDGVKKAAIETMLANTAMLDKYKYVLRKMLDYFNSNDFKAFYVVNNKAHADNAKTKIKNHPRPLKVKKSK